MLLELGPHRFDITHRAIVMGILGHTANPTTAGGRPADLDAFLAEAERLVADGADGLDVAGVTAEPGPAVSEAEELERVVPAIEALHARFDAPISCTTGRASVARAAYAAGAVVGHDRTGFADPDYLPAAAEAGASVITTHTRPGRHDDVVLDVHALLAEQARRAEDLGLPRERIMVDAGLGLGKTEAQSLLLLRRSASLVGLGYPVSLSAPSAPFGGHRPGAEATGPQGATHAAHALGIGLGCRIVRAHDVHGARRVSAVMAAVLAARIETGAVA